MSYPSLVNESAADQVLRIPELLESILQNFTQRELLLAQRVSRRFNSTINGSIRLQRALFLAPDWSRDPRRKPENNRLLLRAFPGCYPTVTLVIKHDKPSREDLAVGRQGSEHWSWDVCISFPADKKPAANDKVDYAGASWRRMYLCQPPCPTLHLVRRWQRSTHAAIERSAGITMGDFYDEATTVQAWHSSYISSDRDWHFEGNIRCSSVEE